MRCAFNFPRLTRKGPSQPDTIESTEDEPDHQGLREREQQFAAGPGATSCAERTATHVGRHHGTRTISSAARPK